MKNTMGEVGGSMEKEERRKEDYYLRFLSMCLFFMPSFSRRGSLRKRVAEVPKKRLERALNIY